MTLHAASVSLGSWQDGLEQTVRIELSNGVAVTTTVGRIMETGRLEV